MNFLQLLAALNEANTVYNELQQDGTLAKVEAAGGALEGELASNTKLKDLETKVLALFPHVVPTIPAAPTAPAAPHQ